jgi:PleD family two-component response regulator
MDFIIENYKWLFSGIGVIILGFVIKLIFPKKKPTDKEVKQKNHNSITINNTISNHVGNCNGTNNSEVDDKTKENTRILFVDDEHTKFKMVSIMKRAGWINTKSVKDIYDMDDHKIHESNVIFVDINGVGTTLFEDQGLGLASALKEKYPDKKIVLYSAESTGDRFHKALRAVDDCLPKNAEPYQFINLVETLIR